MCRYQFYTTFSAENWGRKWIRIRNSEHNPVIRKGTKYRQEILNPRPLTKVFGDHLK